MQRAGAQSTVCRQSDRPPLILSVRHTIQEMLDLPLSVESSCIWPQALRPNGHDTSEKESFESWWAKHKRTLPNICKPIAEQWIYRHWDNSPFSFLPLDTLTWETRTYSSEDFLANVHFFFGSPAEAEWDYKVFHGENNGDGMPLQTAKDWVNGTWSFPPVVLDTRNGFRCTTGDFPCTRLLLVEGSKRYRYLNALHYRGTSGGPHEFFLIHSPLCE